MLVFHHINQKAEDEEIRQAKILCQGIKNKILDLKKSKLRRGLTESEFNYLIENYNKLPISDIAKTLKRACSTIKYIAGDLGLAVIYLNDNEITLNNLYKVLTGFNIDVYQSNLIKQWGLKITDTFPRIVNILDFYNWYKDHLKILQVNNYEIGTFSNEPDWFIEKVNADKRAFEYINKRKWTTEDDNLLMQLVNDNKTYFECSKILKRTGAAIKRRCLDLSIKKPRRTNPCKWTDEQFTTLKELWLKGYEPCIIAEEINRSDREIISFLERNKYYGMPPQKFNSPQ